MDVHTKWLNDRTLELKALRPDGLLATIEISWPTPALAEAHCEAAIQEFREPAMFIPKVVGQGQKTIRKGPFFISVLWGPPTWRLPRAHLSIKRRKVMVGWLQRGYVIAWGIPRGSTPEAK